MDARDTRAVMKVVVDLRQVQLDSAIVHVPIVLSFFLNNVVYSFSRLL
jgi:hypothetical protein